MVGVTGAIIGAAALSAGASVISGNKAAKAQKQAAAQQAANERYFYDTTRSDQAPYRQVGQGALYKLADMYGVSRPENVPAPASSTNPAMTGLSGVFGFNAPTAAQTPQQQMTAGYEGFEASPGYQFRLGEGMKAIERSAAARGGLNSGATMKSLQRYGEGLASSEYENYANALRSMAGLGQTSTQATSAAGANAAQGISNAFQNAGNARASSYANTGAAINQGVSNIMGAYLQGGFGGGGGFAPQPFNVGAALSPGVGGIGSGGSVSQMMPSWYG